MGNSQAQVLASSRQELRTMLMGRWNGTQRALLNPIHDARWTDDNVEWERWSVQTYGETEPRLPLLVARPASGPSPVVIFAHGTAKSKADESLTKHMARYVRDLNMACVSFDSRYHGERAGLKDDQTATRDERGRAYLDRLIEIWRSDDGERPFIYDSAVDAMRVVDFIESKPEIFDSSRIGMTGISLGGMITWFAAAADERIKVAAPSIGVQHFAYAYETDKFQGRVESLQRLFDAAKDDLGKPDIDRHVFKAVLDKITPGLLDTYDAPTTLPLIAPRPLLIVNGEDDHRCPIEAVTAVYLDDLLRSAYSDAPANVSLYIGRHIKHQVTDDMWGAIDLWFHRHLLSSSPSAEQQDEVISSSSSGGPAEAKEDDSFCPASSSFLRDPKDTDIENHLAESLAYLKTFDFFYNTSSS